MNRPGNPGRFTQWVPPDGVQPMDAIDDIQYLESILIGPGTKLAALNADAAQDEPSEPAVPYEEETVFQKIAAFVEKFKGVDGQV